MPARRAIASIDTPWKPPCSPTSCFVTSRSCSRRSAALMRPDVTPLTHPRLHRCNLHQRNLHHRKGSDPFRRRNGGDCMLRDTEIAIVGAGFSGIAMAVELKRSGREDFVLLERGHDVGGTWRDNSYPGCACDVPSHLYSFSFAPNPEWSSTFSPQEEIWSYLRDVARREGVYEHTVFG